jgi:hypothetical protein
MLPVLHASSPEHPSYSRQLKPILSRRTFQSLLWTRWDGINILVVAFYYILKSKANRKPSSAPKSRGLGPGGCFNYVVISLINPRTNFQRHVPAYIVMLSGHHKKHTICCTSSLDWSVPNQIDKHTTNIHSATHHLLTGLYQKSNRRHTTAARLLAMLSHNKNTKTTHTQKRTHTDTRTPPQHCSNHHRYCS